MPAIYDLTAHAFLSGKASALQESNPDQFAFHQLLAETLLGLPSVAVPSQYTEKVSLAVAMQVNFQIEQGVDPFVYKELWLMPQKQHKVFVQTFTDPRALAMVQGILFATNEVGSGWADMKSFRRE